MQTHAQLPVALHLTGDLYRVYFASRDARSRSHVGWAELDVSTGSIGAVSEEPVLAPGPLGNFDDHGVYPASIERAADGRLFLYTIGWNPGVRSPLFYASIGLAISSDEGKTFHRHSSAPIMARSEHDPCLVTSPFVRREGSRWRMWYVSGFRWEETDGELRSFYDVKEAESDDGIAWRREGKVAIAHAEGERNIARPSVVADAGGLRMWFSSAGTDGYRIGTARSTDGISWTREGDVAVEPRGEWDGAAQAYPWVFAHEGRLHMLYNGDRFGAAGFGLAVEEQSL